MKELFFAIKDGVRVGNPMEVNIYRTDKSITVLEVTYNDAYQPTAIETENGDLYSIQDYAEETGMTVDEVTELVAFVVPESAKINRWNGFLDYDKVSNKMIRAILDTFEDNLNLGLGAQGGDLHNEVFNTSRAYDYEDSALAACESVGVFSAIRLVKKYEGDAFGELNSEIDPVPIANMVVYIGGEYLLSLSEYLREVVWDKDLTEFDLSIIEMEVVEELKHLALFENTAGANIDTLIWDHFETY